MSASGASTVPAEAGHYQAGHHSPGRHCLAVVPHDRDQAGHARRHDQAPVIVTPRPTVPAGQPRPMATRTPPENGRNVSPACSGVKPRPIMQEQGQISANE